MKRKQAAMLHCTKTISDIAPSYMKSTFNCDAAMHTYIKAGVSSQKILMGLPLYGRGWQGVTSANLNGFSQIASNIPPNGTWEAGMPFLFNPSTGIWISYDDVTSISVKSDYVKKKQLDGTFFWELSSDRQGELVSAAYNVFSNTAQKTVSRTTARFTTVTTTGSLLSMTTTLTSSVIAKKNCKNMATLPYVYSIADEVTHDGRQYSCRPAHTSLPGWKSNCVRALWLKDKFSRIVY
ncbi:unnamed protein product [Rotaria socialis]|uniref:GH18 domain-containing protein n=1 Tax=Rotaria socialis TaxID=392032 RepID=A0A817Z7P6_9BILA|nr:unnamed protein product [Rotaria socialis]